MPSEPALSALSTRAEPSGAPSLREPDDTPVEARSIAALDVGARLALVRGLGVAVGELTAVGDLEAARIAADALVKLVSLASRR